MHRLDVVAVHVGDRYFFVLLSLRRALISMRNLVGQIENLDCNLFSVIFMMKPEVAVKNLFHSFYLIKQNNDKNIRNAHLS